jgi:hypothetical protein
MKKIPKRQGQSSPGPPAEPGFKSEPTLANCCLAGFGSPMSLTVASEECHGKGTILPLMPACAIGSLTISTLKVN